MKKQDAIDALIRLKEGEFVTCEECDATMHKGCMCCAQALKRSKDLKTIESYISSKPLIEYESRLVIVDNQILITTQMLAEEMNKMPGSSKSQYLVGVICGLNNERTFLRNMLDQRKEEEE